MSKYVGKRIVPKHCGYWDRDKPYEMENIVYDRASGNSYISRKAVPAGTDITQEEYWALCSDFNEQMDLLEKHFTATEQRIAADNDATEQAIRENNAATENAIREDNAAAIQRVDDSLNETEQTLTDTVNAARTAMTQQKQSFDSTAAALNTRMDSVLAAGTGDGATEVLDARVDEEGTTHASLGAAIRERVNYLKAELAKKANVLVNLYDREAEDIEEGGYYLSSDGAWQADENWTSSGFIPVEAGKCYRSNRWFASTRLQFCFYNDQKEFLSGTTTPTADGYLEIPAGAAYLRYPVSVKRRATETLVEGKEKPPAGLPYNQPVLVAGDFMIDGGSLSHLYKRIDELVDGAQNTDMRTNYLNLEDPDVVYGQYCIKNNDQLQWSPMENIVESGYIETSPGDMFVSINATSGYISKLVHFVYFDENKKPIVDTYPADENNVFVTPQNAAYLRFPFNESTQATRMLIKLTGDDPLPFPAEPIPYNPYNKYGTYSLRMLQMEVTNLSLALGEYATREELTSVTGSVSELRSDFQTFRDNLNVETIADTHWKGKTWYAYGTSMTATGTGKFVPVVKELGQFGTVVNKGIGGGSLTPDGYSHGTMKTAVMNTTDGKLNADLITLEVLPNEGATVGDIYDTDDASFCGCLNQAIRYLQENTNAQIVLILMIGGNTSAPGTINSSRGITFHEFRAKAREVGFVNCVPVIDAAGESGFGYARVKDRKYQVDNIHLNDLGGDNMGRFIWSKLKEIPLWRSSL